MWRVLLFDSGTGCEPQGLRGFRSADGLLRRALFKVLYQLVNPSVGWMVIVLNSRTLPISGRHALLWMIPPTARGGSV